MSIKPTRLPLQVSACASSSAIGDLPTPPFSCQDAIIMACFGPSSVSELLICRVRALLSLWDRCVHCLRRFISQHLHMLNPSRRSSNSLMTNSLVICIDGYIVLGEWWWNMPRTAKSIGSCQPYAVSRGAYSQGAWPVISAHQMHQNLSKSTLIFDPDQWQLCLVLKLGAAAVVHWSTATCCNTCQRPLQGAGYSQVMRTCMYALVIRRLHLK